MLLVGKVCKYSYLFSKPLIQLGHECLVITGVVNPCYDLDSLLPISNMLVESKSQWIIALHNGSLQSIYSAVGEGKVLFEIFAEHRMFTIGIVKREAGSSLFNLVYLTIFLTELLDMGYLG